MTRLAILLAMLAACSKDNPYYCDEQCQMMLDGGDGDSGGSNVCVNNIDCADEAGKPVCDTTGACVACTATDIGACAGTSPICVAAMNMCAPCEAHAECKTSDACLPTGACGTDAEVAYVATGGSDTNPCTKALPCATLSYAAGVKSFVKLENDLMETVTLANVTVTVLADPGTVIRPATLNALPVITISGTSNVTLKHVVVSNGETNTGHGIAVTGTSVTLTLEDVAIVSNAGVGLSFIGGTLTMSRSLVAANDEGGADLGGTFNVSSSIFVGNGTSNAAFGGVKLTPGSASASFAFNTVADNQSNTTPDLGIGCVSTLITLNSVLVSGNGANGCPFEYSMFDSNAPSGTMNKNGVPHFKNTTFSSPPAADYYRIENNSDAIDSGAPTSTVMTDIDGESRPQNGVRDIGADEYK